MTEQLVTFRITGDLWGIDIIMVREIIRGLKTTRVPRSPDYIHGLTNLRGRLVTVFDLSKRIGRSGEGYAPGDTCIILKRDTELEGVEKRRDASVSTGAYTIGLLVDSIGDVIMVDGEKLRPGTVRQESENGRFISGILQLEDDIVLLVSLEHVLEHSNEKSAILR